MNFQILPGNSIVGLTNTTALNSTDTNYALVGGTFLSTHVTTEASRQFETGPTAFTLKNLTAKLVTAPGGSASRTYRLRKNGANGNLTFAISGASTTGSDTTNSDSIVEDDLINWSQTPASTPASSGDQTYSMTMFIAPGGGGGTVVKDLISFGMIPFAR